jgi:hypothetical protein
MSSTSLEAALVAEIARSSPSTLRAFSSIHSTPQGRDKNVMRCQGIPLLEGSAASGEPQSGLATWR